MKSVQEYVLTTDGVHLFVETRGGAHDALIVPNRVYLTDPFAYLAEDRRVILFDPRNRGISDRVDDESKLARGIHHDVDDIEAIRQHFDLRHVALLGHSYMATVVMLYAMTYPQHVSQVVLIGAPGPTTSQQYQPEAPPGDSSRERLLARIGELLKERDTYDAVEFCKAFWAVLRELYVLNPADAPRLSWEPCHLPNEMNFMKPFTEHVMPSLQRLQLTSEDFKKVTAPVLGIHGRYDRSAPYGGGRDWVAKLPDARLLTIEQAAHVPWIEAPAMVLGAIRTFLDGHWPDGAEQVAVASREEHA